MSACVGPEAREAASWTAVRALRDADPAVDADVLAELEALLRDAAKVVDVLKWTAKLVSRAAAAPVTRGSLFPLHCLGLKFLFSCRH